MALWSNQHPKQPGSGQLLDHISVQMIAWPSRISALILKLTLSFGLVQKADFVRLQMLKPLSSNSEDSKRTGFCFLESLKALKTDKSAAPKLLLPLSAAPSASWRNNCRAFLFKWLNKKSRFLDLAWNLRPGSRKTG